MSAPTRDRPASDVGILSLWVLLVGLLLLGNAANVAGSLLGWW